MTRSISALLGWALTGLVLMGAGGPMTRAEPDAPAPSRIVSINACADQYLLNVLPRERIVALSPFAADPSVSFFADLAGDIPRVRDDVESVLQLQPDLVVASVFNRSLTLALLRKMGVPVLAIDHPTTIAEVRAQLLAVPAALGDWQAGARMAAELDDALARSAGQASGQWAMFYDRGGYTLGSGTLTGQLLVHIGLQVGASESGMRAVSIEQVIARRPEILVVPERTMRQDTKAPGDQGAALLDHPALNRLYPAPTRLAYPTTATVCPGPSLAKALDLLVISLKAREGALR
jgi:iron complex transport system substrate-binding protein